MLTIEHLTFSYPDYSESGEKHLLFSDLNLCVETGESLLFLAPPDAGKSTLVKIISRGVPRYTSGELHGSIAFDDLDILNTPPQELLSHLTCIFQNPQEQLLMNTVEDEIAFPLESLSLPPEEIEERIERVLAFWDLSSLRRVHPHELSGGERKRVLLAVTDAIDAPLWILDEVFDDLDLSWKRKVLDVLDTKRKTTLLLASRFLPEFEGRFSRIVTLRDGILQEIEERDLDKKGLTQSDNRTEFTPSCDSTLLSLQDTVIVHPRKSERSGVPFRLSVGSLEVSQGEVVALVGENGAGKSTLARVLCGLDEMLEGTCVLNSEDLSARKRRLNIAYLFQNPDFSIFLPTVEEELSYSLKKQGMGKKEIQERVKEVCRQFTLLPDANPTLMSYGAKKRLQAAVSLMLDRPFIIIDEIDSGMTYEMAYESIELLRANGAGIIIITHDPSIASSLAHRTYTIQKGFVREEGVV